MERMDKTLRLKRCPWCGIAKPNPSHILGYDSRDDEGTIIFYYDIFKCGSCFNLVMRRIQIGRNGFQITKIIPEEKSFDDAIPERALADLTAAYETIHQPTASIIMSSRAVDTMLQLKGYLQNYLNDKIIEAFNTGVLTEDMKKWADEVRLDANAERHNRLTDEPPNKEDAERTLSFATTIAEILFVIPARVTRGLQPGITPPETTSGEGNAPEGGGS